MHIRDIAPELKETPFLRKLLEEFIDRGLGSLPGRETTITLVTLLLKHHPSWRKKPPHDYELARLLRTSPRKIRNIRDEISYRTARHDDDWCRSKLAKELKRAKPLNDGQLVSFQIDDGLVRDFAQKLVRERYGLVEYGLNAAIIKITQKQFAELALAVMPPDDRDCLLKEVAACYTGSKETPLRMFLAELSKSAGKKAGESVVRALIAVVTGGASEIPELFRLMKASNDENSAS